MECKVIRYVCLEATLRGVRVLSGGGNGMYI